MSIQMLTENTGPDCYKITATAEFDCPAAVARDLLWNWEQFVQIGLPGMTSGFTWLSGRAAEAPSKFQFEIAGELLKEEIYELSEAEDGYLLRYRALEPALGVEEYDAVLRLQQVSESRTSFQAIREVRLESGASPDMLSELVRSETQCLVEHFST
jgi:hypothetical protein